MRLQSYELDVPIEILGDLCMRHKLWIVQDAVYNLHVCSHGTWARDNRQSGKWNDVDHSDAHLEFLTGYRQALYDPSWYCQIFRRYLRRLLFNRRFARWTEMVHVLSRGTTYTWHEWSNSRAIWVVYVFNPKKSDDPCTAVISSVVNSGSRSPIMAFTSGG